MFVLPRALSSLGAYRQFIVFKVVPSARPGKTDKLPVDWRTGAIANAHDPSVWLDWQTAAAYAEAFGPNHGVGFVFTTGCGHWFIDADNCLLPDRSGWSPIALELMSRFAGAACEVSLSGAGIHLIGQGTAPAPRKIKYGNLFDLYTEGRFVALTGTNIVGDSGTDHTAALAVLVAQYLQVDTGPLNEWTTAAVPSWRGPEDDNALIDRAMRSQSAQQAFGNRASFADLFTGDVAVLSKCYPDDHQGRSWDESRADSALAQALAFWTGNNCERIERIMRLSALARPKWDARDDYLKRTILLVVARQYDVLQDKPPEPATTTVAATGDAAVARAVTGETYLNVTDQINLFKGCVYVWGIHRALVPGGHLLKPEQFKVMYGGYTFPMDPINERLSRNAWEAFTESQCYRSPRADALCFRPDRPPGEVVTEAGMTLANVWWPIETPQADGDVTPFLSHLAKLLPVVDDRQKLLAFMAAVVQYPGVKFQWAPLVQGVKGNGKTFLLTALTQCVGERYTHLPNLAGDSQGVLKFTGWLQGKLLVGFEEVYMSDRREVLEALKPIITNARIEIQGKGDNQITGDNRANIMAFSNHKDAVPKSNDERRWGIFYTAQQEFEDLERDGMHGRYFPDLYDWAHGRNVYEGKPKGFAIINRYLRTYKIPHELNPAVDAHRAPTTSTTAEAITVSMGAIEQEILEAIEQGRPGFSGGWVSSLAVDKLLMHLKADRRVPPGKRRELLNHMGYEWHPALKDSDGRVNNAVQPDGGKPKLYIKRGHILQNLTTPTAVAKNYSDAQSVALTSTANFGR